MRIQPEMTKTQEITRTEPDKHVRPMLRVIGVLISLYVCRCLAMPRWQFAVVDKPYSQRARGRRLDRRLSPGDVRIHDMFVVPDTRGKVRFHLRPNNP
jgi:hypothetical protein